ncbi:GNAT family N-acetyltransferase [Micromonospora acroterricola]|uniref:GNAT family N-acetyltransferase n=1 Tax=Micromonospora acroterricola TaxID=2202421 RepID=A0A317CVT4_9ACTN|nr:GNAT family N-acetyltransferase [Micromonospora acroterricola]PWR06224.1 GNAT family N-acetyltransferase [Micromonospora acroterricola]
MIEMSVLTPDDWPIWRELRLAALTEAPEAFGAQLADWQGDGDTEQRWRDRLAIPGSHNLVASLDGRPVAMASGVPMPTEGEVALTSMWVHPDARGRGVGDRLVDEVARWAKEQGAQRVGLGVAPDNAAAIGLYRRTGFTPGEELGQILPNGLRAQVLFRSL